MGLVRRRATAFAGAALLSWGRLAEAQPGPAEVARESFSAGLAAERAGKNEEACARFRESLGLVRELGPLEKAAACDEREGKLKSAAALLDELLLRLPPGDPDRAALEERFRAARARLGAIVVTLRPDAPAGIEARIDGTPVSLPAGAIVVDPGRHELVVKVPGKGVELREVEVGAGGRSTVEIPGVAPPPAPPLPAPSPSAQREPEHPLRTAGWVIGGIGVAGFIGVAATGIPLLGRSSAFDECADVSCQREVLSDANPLVAVNTVMWGMGIAGLGVGATLLVIDATSDDGPEVTATALPNGAVIRGRF